MLLTSRATRSGRRIDLPRIFRGRGRALHSGRLSKNAAGVVLIANAAREPPSAHT
jgi:hypothetical protein